MCSSGCMKPGHLGCEAWIAKEFKLSDGTLVKIEPSNVIIAHSTPRILLVIVRASKVMFDVLVVHGPTTKATPDDISAF